MKINQRKIKGVGPSSTLALSLLIVFAAGTPVAHAAPICNATVAIPTDGNIPSASSVTNNSYQACFPSTIGEVNNYGTFTNNPNASLSSTGLFNNKAGSKFSNGGTLYNYGVLNNEGTFQVTTDGRLNNFGSINVLAGGSFSSAQSTYVRNNVGAAIFNSGTFTTSSRMDNRGLLQNNAGAVWNSYGFFEFSIAASGTMINSGTYYGETTNVDGTFINNSGAIANVGSTLSISNGGVAVNDGVIKGSSLTINSGAMLTGAGTATLNYGVVNVNGYLSQGALSYSNSDLVGTGIVHAPVTMNSGTLNAGPSSWGSVGKLTIDGDLNVKGGTVLVDIAGTNAGEFDVLDVSGDITLTGGGITFRFDPSFVPKVGDSWTFLTGDTTGLTLDSLLLTFPKVAGVGFVVNVLGNGLQLSTVPVPASAWLLGSGVFGLAGLARRKLKSA